MQHRMLAIAALAAIAAALPIAAAQGATASSKKKIAQGYFYGGITAAGYPVVIQLSKTGKKVVQATIGIELKCQTPGDVTLPDSFKNLPISAAGKFSYTYGPEEVVGDPATGVSKIQVSGYITGTVNRAKTRVKGTWNQKIVAFSAADPTGATILDTCDSGVVSYKAEQ
jgi:hypothetical protein